MASLRQTIRDFLLSIGERELLSRCSGKAAQERGTELLIRNLSLPQREQYQTRGYFEVTGGDTGKRYRIQRGYQMNVEELDQTGRRIRLLCFMRILSDLPFW